MINGKSGLGLVGPLALVTFVVFAAVLNVWNEYGWRPVVGVAGLGAVLTITPWLLTVGLPYLRGRRGRDRGIPCVQCHRTAFPIEGTATHYRCWNCGSRFEGPEHF